MAGVLQEGVEQELAVPGGIRRHWLHHHQGLPRPHRRGRQEFALRAEAQEVSTRKLVHGTVSDLPFKTDVADSV